MALATFNIFLHTITIKHNLELCCVCVSLLMHACSTCTANGSISTTVSERVHSQILQLCVLGNRSLIRPPCMCNINQYIHKNWEYSITCFMLHIHVLQDLSDTCSPPSCAQGYVAIQAMAPGDKCCNYICEPCECTGLCRWLNWSEIQHDHWLLFYVLYCCTVYIIYIIHVY